MSKPKRARFLALEALLLQRRPDVAPDAIPDGRVLVDGRVVANPAARVRADASLRVTPERRLRGDMKLSHALEAFEVAVVDRVAVDVGASAGGFTTALLNHGARRVYAVDAGIGQLRGGLRLDRRVVNLEGTNLGELNTSLVPDSVELVTMDLSYLSLADAVPQLEALQLAHDAELVALVKPTFELRRGALASTPSDLAEASRHAARAAELAGWRIEATSTAPPTGQRRALEGFIHAQWLR